MKSEAPFKSKFADYLTKKITPQKMDSLFQGQFSQHTQDNRNSISHPQLIFEDPSLTHTPHSNISIFSLNSSEFTQSKFKSPTEGSSSRRRLRKLREL